MYDSMSHALEFSKFDGLQFKLLVQELDARAIATSSNFKGKVVSVKNFHKNGLPTMVFEVTLDILAGDLLAELKRAAAGEGLFFGGVKGQIYSKVTRAAFLKELRDEKEKEEAESVRSEKPEGSVGTAVSVANSVKGYKSNKHKLRQREATHQKGQEEKARAKEETAREAEAEARQEHEA